MAITNFIPTIWSETLYQQLDREYIGVANCNRDFEGEIKGLGSVVKICGVGNITLSDYTKNTDMSSPQTLSDTVKELRINQAKCFNFQIDDIDRAQASPKLMEAAMHNAASALAQEADRQVFGLISGADKIIDAIEPTEEEILNAFLSARKYLYEQNVVDNSDIVIEVSPAVAEILLKAKILLSSDNTAALEKGCLGTIAGCKVFVTNSIYTELEDQYMYYYCSMRSKRAVAYAEQISDIEAYRPEKRFADAVKGLLLFGISMLYPEEIVSIKVGVLAETEE